MRVLLDDWMPHHARCPLISTPATLRATSAFGITSPRRLYWIVPHQAVQLLHFCGFRKSDRRKAGRLQSSDFI